jgi:hypothetical protein
MIQETAAYCHPDSRQCLLGERAVNTRKTFVAFDAFALLGYATTTMAGKTAVGLERDHDKSRSVVIRAPARRSSTVDDHWKSP